MRGREWLSVGLYFVTGVLTTILTQVLTNEGFNHSKTLMRSFANYLGNSFSFFLPSCSAKDAPVNDLDGNAKQFSFVHFFFSMERKTGILIALLILTDFANSVMQALGITVAGSGMFQVIYSCSLVWVALSSRFLLNKSLVKEQWLGVFLCVSGLIVSSFDLDFSEQNQTQIIIQDQGNVASIETMMDDTINVPDTENTRVRILMSIKEEVSRWLILSKDSATATSEGEGEGEGEKGGSTTTLAGLLISLLASITAASSYLVAELVSSQPDCPPPPALCSLVGSISLLIISIFCINFTIPLWDSLVTEPMAESGGSYTVVFWTLGAIAISQLIHNTNYFKVTAHSGAVTTGLVTTLRGVSVFMISHFLYCDSNSSQCFTFYKGLSALFIATGIIVYSIGKTKHHQKKKKRKKPEGINLI